MQFPKIGPGFLVAAAFIGPGTVTVCISAGAEFGYNVVWAIVIATLAAILFQEMAARLGIVSGKGLGEALLGMSTSPLLRNTLIALLVVALYIGNAAYEGGNLSGAALGASAALGTGPASVAWLSALIASIAGLLLYFGAYKSIEKVLIALVLTMAAAFVVTALMVEPDWTAVAHGMVPRVTQNNAAIVMALIGTTIVPYNLFLHARAVRETWQQEQDLPAARLDTILSVGLGGFISLLILVSAAASFFANGIVVNGAPQMAQLLEPVFGSAARYLLALGLLSAGLTSSITAPLATAYALSECIPALKPHFKAIALSVVAIGVVLSGSGFKPLLLIFFAQMANGLLLPIIAVCLLMAMNNKALLGSYCNKAWQNALAAVVVLLAALLGLRFILRALGVWA